MIPICAAECVVTQSCQAYLYGVVAVVDFGDRFDDDVRPDEYGRGGRVGRRREELARVVGGDRDL